MKNLIMIVTLIATAFVFVSGCGKKEEAAAPGGCPLSTVMSPGLGTCLARANCPRGFGQHPTQLSMCVDLNTGDIAMPQQCGAGWVLTASGCYQQGPCQPGQALVAETCKNAAQVSGTYNQQPYYQQNNGFGGNPWGGTPYGGMNPYRTNPYGGMQYGNPYGYYRGF